ncbi:MAG: helix-turn-helix domain-containing protein [Bacteroidota bacterium]
MKRTIKFLQELVGGVEEGKSSGRKAPSLGDLQDEVWDDQKLKAQFKISTSTVYRRRKDGTFKFFKIGSLYYYYRSDILPHRDRFLK